jgi:hypothetical protein
VTSNRRKADLYRAGNIEAAEIILADIHRYGGDEPLMVRWARRLVADSERRVAA